MGHLTQFWADVRITFHASRLPLKKVEDLHNTTETILLLDKVNTILDDFFPKSSTTLPLTQPVLQEVLTKKDQKISSTIFDEAQNAIGSYIESSLLWQRYPNTNAFNSWIEDKLAGDLSSLNIRTFFLLGFVSTLSFVERTLIIVEVEKNERSSPEKEKPRDKEKERNTLMGTFCILLCLIFLADIYSKITRPIDKCSIGADLPRLGNKHSVFSEDGSLLYSAEASDEVPTFIAQLFKVLFT